MSDLLDQVRYFDPLKYPSEGTADIVLHIPIQLNSRGSRRAPAGGFSDFDGLKWNLNNFKKNPKGFHGILVVSVNGFIDDGHIDNLKWIDEKVINNQWGDWNVTVFQRPNYGYQWGGFYDVWLKYKEIDCKYYATLECDCFLQGDWWKKSIDLFESRGDQFGFVGMAPDKEVRKHLLQQYTFSGRLWDCHSNMRHSRGGFYLCRRELLDKMDRFYGHFTLSLGNNQELDGVACGEIQFSSKTRHLGFSYSVLQPTEVSVQVK